MIHNQPRQQYPIIIVPVEHSYQHVWAGNDGGLENINHHFPLMHASVMPVCATIDVEIAMGLSMNALCTFSVDGVARTSMLMKSRCCSDSACNRIAVSVA